MMYTAEFHIASSYNNVTLYYSVVKAMWLKFSAFWLDLKIKFSVYIFKVHTRPTKKYL